MPKSLQCPVVLLTGASSGIGYDVAPLLVRYGYTVYGAARRVEKIEELAPEGVKALSMDVADEASMEAAVQQIIDAEGRIDVLINNAGYGSYGAIEDVSIDEARRQFEVNLFGLARLTQLVLPHMRARVLPRPWVPGTTPPSTPSRRSAMRCAWKLQSLVLTWSLSSPAASRPPGGSSRQTTWRNPPETVSTLSRRNALRQICVSSIRRPPISQSPR